MPPNNREGCTTPTAGLIGAQPPEVAPAAEKSQERTVKMTARVGKPAPDFEATGYFEGSFKNFKLSDYRGKWVLLCFYPSDFTFV